MTLPRPIDQAIVEMAKRDGVTQAAKALQLIESAIELEEDRYLDRLARTREQSNAGYVSHAEAWK